jgi:hypothetical protein
VLALETPLAGLEEASQRLLAEAITRAASQRLLVSMGSADTGTVERSLLDGLDEVWVLQQGNVVARGPAAEVLVSSNRYLVVVTRQAHRLVELLQQSGARAALTSATTPSPQQPAGWADSGRGAGRLIVDLGPDQTTDVIADMALAAEAPVIELLPLTSTAG